MLQIVNNIKATLEEMAPIVSVGEQTAEQMVELVNTRELWEQLVASGELTEDQIRNMNYRWERLNQMF